MLYLNLYHSTDECWNLIGQKVCLILVSFFRISVKGLDGKPHVDHPCLSPTPIQDLSVSLGTLDLFRA